MSDTKEKEITAENGYYMSWFDDPLFVVKDDIEESDTDG